MRKLNLKIFLLFLLCSLMGPIWSWKCEKGHCQKRLTTIENRDIALSLAECRLLCSQSAYLWPKPKDVAIGSLLEEINVNDIIIEGTTSETPIYELIQAAGDIFKNGVRSLVPETVTLKGKPLLVRLDIENTDINKITLDLDEVYSLEIWSSIEGNIKALIRAQNFFGARHGLTTLSQLIVYNDLREILLIPKDACIVDEPTYPYRGVLVDTARNYITVDAIKRIITGMGASKLNALHWHITDSHSFPFVSKSQPMLSDLGAYSSKKVYTPSDIEEIVKFARERGVRIVPEFDAPAHVGEGWQATDFVTCFNLQPWQEYCFEPPCGQFDPTKAELYNVIEDIYGDMITQFEPDIFHMGGDEVNFNCWNSTKRITDWMTKKMGPGLSEEDFMKLWNYFQSQVLERLYKKAGRKLPVVLWTSHLTQKEYAAQYLSKEKYIIQVWARTDDNQLSDLLDMGYKVILTNYDVFYMDCGFGGWLMDGNNWCSPYIGWQKIYEKTPTNITGGRTSQILGAEVALWSEEFDSSAVDSRLWPRAAALAEVLWNEPTTDWRAAKQRFSVHRERLVALGIHADGVQPEWCLQNEGIC